MVKPLLSIILFFNVLGAFAQNYSLRGDIRDAHSNEILIGASITISNAEGRAIHSTSTGLNGLFRFERLPVGNYTVLISMEGYDSLKESVDINANVHKRFAISSGIRSLDEVQVSRLIRGTDAEARALEKVSPNVVNMISARQIELSPDITVANVIQRVSGLSIERNANGDPQYAIVRGMDKRYNNTLINGVKIPSPDNENRFVPLDIFPAVFLDRLEVFKSLTANMEADAIGGTVNMVMKSAPDRRLFNADLQVGYNHRNFSNDFATYDRSRLNRQSPKELFGESYRAVPEDFPGENMVMKLGRVLPDVFVNATYGNRFMDQKIGLMLGGSFQNSYRPVSNYFYDPSATLFPGNPLNMNELITRNTSSQMQRMAVHAKLDYDHSPAHNYSFYVGHYVLNEFRVRDQVRRQDFVSTDIYSVYPITRFTNIFQNITSFDARGKHRISPSFDADWSAVVSIAKHDRPDDGVFARSGNYHQDVDAIVNEMVYFQGTRNSRTWERNKDNDLSLYVNFKYRPELINEHTEIQFGGMGRLKTRDNYFNYYNYSQTLGLFKGENWDTFADVQFNAMANPLGSGDNSNLVYDATEDVYAGYVNTSWVFGAMKIQAGVRAEHTTQTYEIDPVAASSSNIDLRREQNYLTWFPSLSLKHELNSRTFLKATYFKGISRPGFYEIVPSIRRGGGGDSFYSERGNADLRPSIGHSADIRYEFFPSGINQILVGVFYKKIIDPIEYGFPQVVGSEQPVVSRILPQNFNDATNFGLEADYTKYFNRFGVRANYTYTNSAITTTKVFQNEDASFELRDQKRALQGQSSHIGNLSLLWKDFGNRLDAQLVLNYTGERIAVVSPYLDADHIMRPMTQLDFSIEKGFGSRVVVFAKINNILNTPYSLYVDKPLSVPQNPYPHQTDPYNTAQVRQDVFGQSYRVGLRYNLN